MRALLAGVGLLLLSAAPVMAHASLVASDPPDGAVVTTPFTLTATYDEALDQARSRLVVRDAAGAEVARGAVEDDPLAMVVEVPALAPGVYVVRWTAVTPDDNGVTRGTLTFVVDDTPPAETSAPTTSPEAVPTERPAGIPVLTPLPGTTPRVTPSPTAEPAPATATATATVTATGPVTPVATASPTPADPAAGTSTTDLLLALLIAGALLGALAFYVLRR